MKTLLKSGMTKLQKDFETVANEYIRAFVKKHGYEFTGWVADDVGGIAEFINQYFFSLSAIINDINNKSKKNLIFAQQDADVEEACKYLD